ncbi:MAG TPA: DUF4338 domain-containing protein [Nannocystis exedens]|nr:DUF4338 domain-containing protein [Nannocystis exedens]
MAREDCDDRRYCGRRFSVSELDTIRSLIASNEDEKRAALARLVCDALDWRRANGQRKDMSCRVAMLRMHRDGLIRLPEPTNSNGNGKRRPQLTAASDAGEPIEVPAGQLGALELVPIRLRKESSLWNEMVERYHYLGYDPLPGAQIRYFVSAGGRPLAALGFGASAWKVAPRDQFIGWSHERRMSNLHRVVNNARFLIFPWVRSPNLASRVLAAAAKRLPRDWDERYGYSPVLLETFVEERFRGTCYRAANWVCVGQTQGRGKLDREHRAALPKKLIFLYPLRRDFRTVLCVQ